MTKKKFNIFSGILNLISPEKLFDLYISQTKENKENKENKNKIRNSEKGLKKGPKVRGKHISHVAKQDKKILLTQAKALKKQNPDINRKKIANELAEFSKNYKKVGLSKTFSESYIYSYILKKN